MSKTPHDHEAEIWTVGSLLLRPSILDELGALHVDDFFHDDTRTIVAAMIDLHRRGEPIDAGLVAKTLGTNAWAGRIAEIVRAVPTPLHAVRYAAIVARLAKARRIMQIAETAVDQVVQPDADPDAVVDRLERDLATIRAVGEQGEPITLTEAAVDASVRIDEIVQRGHGAGVLVGLPEFDEKIGGLHPGELTVLAARPGVGKTSLALQVAHHVAGRRGTVYFASLEMSASELSTRLACGAAGVSNHLVRSGRLNAADRANLAEAFRAQDGVPLDIHDSSSLTVHAIRRQIRRRRKHGLHLAVVDYLQLITPDDRKIIREQQVATIVRTLKETAREYGIPVLCLCQLNRQADGDETPRLSQLRESGAIEQDADMVLFLSQRKANGDGANAVLTIAKNRNGATGEIKLTWEPSRTTFSCYDPYPEFS